MASAGVLLAGLLGLEPPAPESQRIRGMTLDARSAPPDAVLDDLQNLGVSHLAVIPYAFLRGDSLRFNPNVRWFSESESGAIELSGRLADRGIELVIKPQVWLGRSGFPGDLDFDSVADWERFEHQYREYILHHARVATRAGSTWFVLGTELARSAIERPDFWRGLAREVRTVFPGRLTYAANWWGEVDSLGFWDAFDAIGVQAYYPLSEARSPGTRELDDGWRPHRRRLAALSRRWNRPVVFTELGYRSTADAAIEPWAWTSRSDSVGLDADLQADLFRAFFDGPWTEPWLQGVFVWKWYGGPERDHWPRDFTPQGKPAQFVIREGFQAASPPGSRPRSDGP